MADNITLNPGSGGDVARTFEDADGAEWFPSVVAFATTLSPGANVLTPVTETDRLPVALDPAATLAASQDGAWTVGISPGQSVAATQSGSWAVGVDGVVEVSGAVAVSGTVAATQSGAWSVGITGTASVSGTVAVSNTVDVAGMVTAAQGGAWTVGVSGAVAATQSGTWTVGVSGSVAATQSGTWDVGTVATVTNVGTVATVSSVTAIANALPAGTNLLGRVSAGQDSASLYNGTTALTPKFAAIAAAASGDNTIVAAVSGKKIRVLRWSLSSNGTVSAKWRSGTTDVTGLRYLTQYAAAGGAYCPVGLFETASGQALVLNLSAAVAVGGEVTYVEV